MSAKPRSSVPSAKAGGTVAKVAGAAKAKPGSAPASPLRPSPFNDQQPSPSKAKARSTVSGATGIAQNNVAPKRTSAVASSSEVQQLRSERDELQAELDTERALARRRLEQFQDEFRAETARVQLEKAEAVEGAARAAEAQRTEHVKEYDELKLKAAKYEDEVRLQKEELVSNSGRNEQWKAKAEALQEQLRELTAGSAASVGDGVDGEVGHESARADGHRHGWKLLAVTSMQEEVKQLQKERLKAKTMLQHAMEREFFGNDELSKLQAQIAHQEAQSQELVSLLEEGVGAATGELVAFHAELVSAEAGSAQLEAQIHHLEDSEARVYQELALEKVAAQQRETALRGDLKELKSTCSRFQRVDREQKDEISNLQEATVHLAKSAVFVETSRQEAQELAVVLTDWETEMKAEPDKPTPLTQDFKQREAAIEEHAMEAVKSAESIASVRQEELMEARFQLEDCQEVRQRAVAAKEHATEAIKSAESLAMHRTEELKEAKSQLEDSEKYKAEAARAELFACELQEKDGIEKGASIVATLTTQNQDLRHDRDVVLAAVRQNGMVLQYVGEELKRDREVVLAAVNQSGFALEFAAPELKNDQDFALAAVQQGGCALKHVQAAFKENTAIVLAAVQQDGRSLEFAAADLRRDRQIVLAAVEQAGCAMAHAADELKHDKDFVISAVQSAGTALEHVAAEFQSDREIVMSAVQQDGRALEYTAQEFRSDKEVVLSAVQNGGKAMMHAAEDVRRDKDVALAAVQQDRQALTYVAKELQKDADILRAVVQQMAETQAGHAAAAAAETAQVRTHLADELNRSRMAAAKAEEDITALTAQVEQLRTEHAANAMRQATLDQGAAEEQGGMKALSAELEQWREEHAAERGRREACAAMAKADEESSNAKHAEELRSRENEASKLAAGIDRLRKEADEQQEATASAVAEEIAQMRTEFVDEVRRSEKSAFKSNENIMALSEQVEHLRAEHVENGQRQADLGQQIAKEQDDMNFVRAELEQWREEHAEERHRREAIAAKAKVDEEASSAKHAEQMRLKETDKARLVADVDHIRKEAEERQQAAAAQKDAAEAALSAEIRRVEEWRAAHSDEQSKCQAASERLRGLADTNAQMEQRHKRHCEELEEELACSHKRSAELQIELGRAQDEADQAAARAKDMEERSNTSSTELQKLLQREMAEVEALQEAQVKMFARSQTAEKESEKLKLMFETEQCTNEEKTEEREERLKRTAKRGQELLLIAQKVDMEDFVINLLLQWSFAAKSSKLNRQLQTVQQDADQTKAAAQQALKERQEALQREADAAHDMFSKLALAEEKERLAQQEALNAAPPERLRSEIEELRRKNIDLLARGSEAAFGPDGRPRTPAQWRAIGTVAEVTAEADVGKIGLGFKSMPPDPLIVKRVVPGEWAEHAGILSHDAILELNGTLVGVMTPASFKEVMAQRPLVIKIWRIARPS